MFIDLDFLPKSHLYAQTFPDIAAEYVAMAVGLQSTQQEADLYKVVDVLRELAQKKGVTLTGYSDVQWLRNKIISYNQIDGLGTPRMPDVIKGQLLIAIREAELAAVENLTREDA